MAIVTRATKGSALTHTEMDQNLLSAYGHYGQLTVSGNTLAIPLAQAVDLTLATNSDYEQVVGVFDPFPSGENNGVVQQAGSLLIGRAAVYHVALWASVTSDVANTNVAFKFAVNGVIGVARNPRTKIGSGGDRVNISAHGFVRLAAGDVVSLWHASDKTAAVTVEDAVFSLFEMRTT